MSDVYGYQWVKVSGVANVGEIIIGEMQILDSNGTNIATNGTAFGAPVNYTAYPAQGAFSGVIGGYQNTYNLCILSSPGYIGYHTTTRMKCVSVRLASSPGYPDHFLVNGTIFGSNNSTDGVDGDWDTLAISVQMSPIGGAWTEFELVENRITRRQIV
ncbi:hypothetical protein L2W58_12995, partial [Dethiosulfovibrio sp. F2B]|uniref:hypothetical protein n=1 Tax=Dethiosulfovibrio faecalis TaxID=2720018 RepID=UPI001F236E75